MWRKMAEVVDAKKADYARLYQLLMDELPERPLPAAPAGVKIEGESARTGYRRVDSRYGRNRGRYGARSQRNAA
ncbi:MAG: hypothetical protein ACREVO_11735 [Steroidobacteraceae bacterium]